MVGSGSFFIFWQMALDCVQLSFALPWVDLPLSGLLESHEYSFFPILSPQGGHGHFEAEGTLRQIFQHQEQRYPQARGLYFHGDQN